MNESSDEVRMTRSKLEELLKIAYQEGAKKALWDARDEFDAFPSDYDNAIVMAVLGERADAIGRAA